MPSGPLGVSAGERTTRSTCEPGDEGDVEICRFLGLAVEPEARSDLHDASAAPTSSRSSRWSPTRSEFAIAVSAGFTAPMLGKMLVSTT